MFALRVHHYAAQNRVPATTAYKWWNCLVIQTCKLLSTHPSKRLFDGFPDPSQFAAAKLTHYSSKTQRPSDSSRSWLRILRPGDVHPNPGPTTMYPCPVCACNVTGRGVRYLCNRCFGWVHSKCSGLQNAAEYIQRKDWDMQLLQYPTHSTDTTTASSINSNTGCRWKFIHHHAIQRKWHLQQTDGIM